MSRTPFVWTPPSSSSPRVNSPQPTDEKWTPVSMSNSCNDDLQSEVWPPPPESITVNHDGELQFSHTPAHSPPPNVHPWPPPDFRSTDSAKQRRFAPVSCSIRKRVDIGQPKISNRMHSGRLCKAVIDEIKMSNQAINNALQGETHLDETHKCTNAVYGIGRVTRICGRAKMSCLNTGIGGAHSVRVQDVCKRLQL